MSLLCSTAGCARIFGLDTHESVPIHARLGHLQTEFTVDEKMTGGKLVWLFARLRVSATSATPLSWPSGWAPTSAAPYGTSYAATSRRPGSFRPCSSSTSPNIRFLRTMSLFHYYGSAVEQGRPKASLVAISLLSLLLAMVVALAFYGRDIYA